MVKDLDLLKKLLRLEAAQEVNYPGTSGGTKRKAMMGRSTFIWKNGENNEVIYYR